MVNTVKRFAAGLVLFSTVVFAQGQLINRGFNLTTTGASAPIDNRAFGCINWSLTFSNNGFSALSIQLESAPDASQSSTTRTPGTFVLFAGTIQTGTGLTTNPSTLATQGTIQGIGYFPWVDARLTSATGTGFVTGVLQCEAAQPLITTSISAASNLPVIGPTAAGSPPSTAPVQVAGTDGANVREILTDASGRQVITCFSGCAGVAAPATYTASTVMSAGGITPAATATDIACIQGSGTKTVFVTRVVLSGQSSGSSFANNIGLLVRSTANSGGTTTALVAVPMDSGNAAATATAVVYTANPASLGTLVGTIEADTIIITSTVTNLPPGLVPVFQESWGTVRGTQPLTLRGTAQEACFNLNAANQLNRFTVRWEWYEQ